jgi:hypothetical protein
MSNRNIPFDVKTERLSMIATADPQPVLDRASGLQKNDANGVGLFDVEVVAMGPHGAEVIRVRVSGAPKGVGPGIPVVVSDLMIAPWSIEGRAGFSFRASSLVSQSASAAKAS